MGIYVLSYGLRPPVENEAIVRAQMRAAHDYRNDLVAIERGRRWALRQVDRSSVEVIEAEDAVRAAPRSDRKALVAALRKLRKEHRDANVAELERINTLDEQLRRDARALTPAYWGTYLSIEASHQQVRKMPLYGDDAVADNDPRFVRGPRWRDSFAPGATEGTWWLSRAQLGMQIQATKPLDTAGLVACEDTRVRLDLGEPRKRGKRGQIGKLWMRIGSDGRAPIWAVWPIKLHRCMPSQAQIKWVRVSVRPEGPWERWTCEITVDDPAPNWRERARPTDGAIAVEWSWVPLDDGAIRVASWRDDRGRGGDVDLPARVATGIRKPDGIRAVRDMIANDAKPAIAKAILAIKGLPSWTYDEARVLHLVKSAMRMHALAMRWRVEGLPACAPLVDWCERDRHLWQYEAGARGEALRERREIYRVLAASWRRKYRTVLLSDQDLSIQARWGDDSDVRFTAGVSELRLALRNAFGVDANVAHWRPRRDEDDDERSWCERSIDEWIAGGRSHADPSAYLPNKSNAWASRKSKSAQQKGGAREPPANAAE